MKAVFFLHVFYLIFIKSFTVKGATKCGSQIELRAVLLSCPVRDNSCEENDLLSQTMDVEQEQLMQANGKTFEMLREKRTNGFPSAVKDCKRKLVITMKVKNSGKVPCEDKYIVVDHVYDPVTGGRGRLLSPVVLKLRQEQMVQLYGLQFSRVVNNEPYEEEISKGNYCSVNPDNPTCGIAMYDGKPIPFSEGFCCSCSPVINVKRQLSSVSRGDSFIYRDSKLISQGHSHITGEVEPTFTKPELVQLRSKKTCDVTMTQKECIRRLKSDEVPNYFIQTDRKIVCDKGDFMNELCRLREEKMKLAMEENQGSEPEDQQCLTGKGKSMQKTQTDIGTPDAAGVTTQVTVPKNPKSKFTLRDGMEVLNVEPGIELKTSRGKRENRLEVEDNTLEENLKNFLKTKKLFRNRRKRLLEIPHRRNHNKETRCSPDDCQEFSDNDYIKPLPPMYFFSHDKIVIDPMEATKSNASNKSPMENAYNGLRDALERNQFDGKHDKSEKKTSQNHRGNAVKESVFYDLNTDLLKKNTNPHKYSLPDKNMFGKEQTFRIEPEDKALENQRNEQENENQDSDPQNEKKTKDERSNIRNYFLSKSKEFINNNFDVEEERKNVMKDYIDGSKDLKGVDSEDGYMKEKIRNFKAGRNSNEAFQAADKFGKGEYGTQVKYEQKNRKFAQFPLKNKFGSHNRNDEEDFDFNVEITHQDFPMVTKPRLQMKNTDQIMLNRPETIRKTKMNQFHYKPFHYLPYDQNLMNSPQDVYFIRAENGPLKFRHPYFHMREPDRMIAEYERSRALSSYYRKPKYFSSYSQFLERPEIRPRHFQYNYDTYNAQESLIHNHKSKNAQEDTEEEPAKKNIRERRSVDEFEPAKGYLASDTSSGGNLAPHELNTCPVETEKKPAEVKPIDINAEILSGLPKLKEKITKVDGRKTQRSPSSDLDRLIQSYLKAPKYVLKQMAALKEGVGEEEGNKYESRNSTCQKSVEGEYTQEIAHCMRFGDLWYSMYNIKKPVVAQTVGLQLFDKRTLNDGRMRWKDLTKGKMIRLGTFLSSAEDDLPSVSLTFAGEESNTLYSPIDPANYVLLVPSHLSDPTKAHFYPQLEGGPAEYLLVNRKDISPGGDCNKIGTSFEAFARQPERCVHSRGSCLKRQPIDLWREDMEARIRGKRGKYFVENFGTVPNSPIKTFTNLTGEYLAMEYYGDYTSTIEVELKADHNLIVRKGRSNAQIPTVFVDGTYPKKTRIYMSVLNTGLTSSNFRPRLGDCPPDLNPSWCPLEGSAVSVPPQKRHDFQLDIPGVLPSDKFQATVQVLNQDNHPVAQRKVRIKRGERCMCAFHCKCNCFGDPEDGKICRKLNDEEYRLAGYPNSPPFRPGAFTPRGFFSNLRLVFVTFSYILLMTGIIKGILGAYFRPLGIAGMRIITGPRKLSRYYEPELQNCTVFEDDFGFPVHPTTSRPVQIVPLCCEIILNIFFFFLYPIRGFWLIFKSSICLKIVLGDCDSSRQDRDSDRKCCSPLLSQQNTCMNYNLTTITSKKFPPDEFLPYLPYRGDNDPLEEDDTEFVLQEMQKHMKK